MFFWLLTIKMESKVNTSTTRARTTRQLWREVYVDIVVGGETGAWREVAGVLKVNSCDCKALVNASESSLVLSRCSQ